MIIGGVWYGPIFGKLFMHVQGWDKRSKEENEAMMKAAKWSYLWQFVASVVMFTVLSFLMYATNATGQGGAVALAIVIWIGFVVPLSFGQMLWGGKMTIFWLTIGNMLLTLIVGAAIIGAWK
jgi:hypothetical protein